jgi:hypothetical protein
MRLKDQVASYYKAVNPHSIMASCALKLPVYCCEADMKRDTIQARRGLRLGLGSGSTVLYGPTVVFPSLMRATGVRLVILAVIVMRVVTVDPG